MSVNALPSTPFPTAPLHSPLIPSSPRSSASNADTPTTRFAAWTLLGERQCTNCGETDTPQWRGTLCNACALWRRSRGTDRPLPLAFPPRKRKSISLSPSPGPYLDPLMHTSSLGQQYDRGVNPHFISRCETCGLGLASPVARFCLRCHEGAIRRRMIREDELSPGRGRPLPGPLAFTYSRANPPPASPLGGLRQSQPRPGAVRQGLGQGAQHSSGLAAHTRGEPVTLDQQQQQQRVTPPGNYWYRESSAGLGGEEQRRELLGGDITMSRADFMRSAAWLWEMMNQASRVGMALGIRSRD